MKWARGSLGDVAPAERAKREFAPDEVVWHLNLDQIESQTGRVLAKQRAPVSSAGNSTFVFDERNVLYSKLRPYLNKVVHPDEPGIGTTELVPLRPRPGVLEADFLKFYLRSDRFVGFANSVVAGAKMPRMIMDKFWEHTIPLPAPKEQRRIVELLEQADGLRRKRTEADALAEHILPALFRKMFGDPNRQYNAVPFSSLVREFRYGTSNRSEGEGKPALRIPNVVGEDLDLSDLKLVPVTDDEFSRLQLLEGDILFVRTNGNPDYVGRCVVFDDYAVRESGFPADEFVFASYLIRARLKPAHANSYFIKQYLQSPGGRAALRERSRTSAGQFNINTEGLGSLPIPLPSLSEQERFALFVLSMRKLRMQRQSSRARIDQIFATMLHHAFTGELTAKWREAHLKELLAEMEQQARLLEPPPEE